MDKKARNNIKASRVLIKNGFYDSSVSRAYYAVYLAAWHYLKDMNIYPQQKAPKGGYYANLFPITQGVHLEAGGSIRIPLPEPGGTGIRPVLSGDRIYLKLRKAA